MNPGPRIPWRRWNAALHRDIGYLVAGLILVYAISGLAVNHRAQWNPHQRRVVKTYEIGALDKTWSEERLTAEAIQRLKAGAKPKSTFQPDEDTLEIHMQDGKYAVDLPTGKVVFEGSQPRPVLATLNRMHLNAAQGLWTWIADAFALSLITLAVTGLFVLKGPKGITGRGAWLTLLGCAIPAGYWIWWVFCR